LVKSKKRKIGGKNGVVNIPRARMGHQWTDMRFKLNVVSAVRHKRTLPVRGIGEKKKKNRDRGQSELRQRSFGGRKKSNVPNPGQQRKAR